MPDRIGPSNAATAVYSSNEPAPVAASPPGALLPEPEVSLDAAAILATLMIEADESRRKNGRADRASAQSAMRGAQSNEISHMREAADDRLAAAQVEAWTQIGAGAVSLGAMGLSAAGGSARNCIMEASSSVMNNGGMQILTGGGKSVSSFLSDAASDADQAAKQAAYGADALKRLAEEHGEDAQAARESMRKAIDFLREFEATRSRSLSGALYRG